VRKLESYLVTPMKTVASQEIWNVLMEKLLYDGAQLLQLLSSAQLQLSHSVIENMKD
jgi:hypothetical protein